MQPKTSNTFLSHGNCVIFKEKIFAINHLTKWHIWTNSMAGKFIFVMISRNPNILTWLVQSIYTLRWTLSRMHCTLASHKIVILSMIDYSDVWSIFWSFEFIFKAKLKLESGNHKIQYGCQVTILKLTPLKINRFLPIYTSILPLKFGVDIQSRTKIRAQKRRGLGGVPYCFQGHLYLSNFKVTWDKTRQIWGIW